MDVKSFSGVEIKDINQGLVSAVFSTFDVVDKDGDIVVAGAIKDGTPIRVSAYGHASWGGFSAAMLPVGKGTIHTDASKAWADMGFFMETAHGKDTFQTIKAMGELQEWSYSLRDMTIEYGKVDGEDVRYIKSVDVHEVSPVLLGASIGTYTMSTKSGLKFQEHIGAVLTEVEMLNTRVQEVVALRAEKGKHVGESSREQLDRLAAQLKALQELLTEADPGEIDEAITKQFEQEYLRYLRFLSLT